MYINANGFFILILLILQNKFNYLSGQSKPILKEYISKEKISRRIKQIAKKINKDYKGKNPIFIGILNGSFIFLSDLIREIKIECEIDFLKLSSYGDEKISSGNVTLLKDLNCQIENRDIIIVEDIVIRTFIKVYKEHN